MQIPQRRSDSASDNQDGEQSKLFVLITCFEGKTKEAVEEIRKISTVTDIKETDGQYDILVTLESDSNEELKKALVHKLRKIKAIRGTLTLRSSDDLGLLG
ncbi:MAG: Lrp/AsnC ligand binding domain-containing protein [Candidatus Nitrosotenuis sp.]